MTPFPPTSWSGRSTASCRTLLEDLRTVYRKLERGDRVQLPAKPASYKLWAEQLVAYADSERCRLDAEHWLSWPSRRYEPLPRDHEGGVNTTASLRFVT